MAQGDYDLYEWAAGTVRLVTILPNGTAVRGLLQIVTYDYGNEGIELESIGFGTSPVIPHSVSEDGSRIVFVAGGNLYERVHADREQSPIDGEGHCADSSLACTVQVDASQTGGLGGGGAFMRASADGSKVFFTDSDAAGLTSDTVAGSGQNLYEYDVETGKLTDLTAAGDARVRGIAGISEKGAYVDFVAEGALKGDANSVGDKAVAGQANLYLSRAGTVTFIATLVASSEEEFGKEAPLDNCDWSVFCLTSKVSPNGMFIGFNSVGNPPATTTPMSTPAKLIRRSTCTTQHRTSSVALRRPERAPPVAPLAFA